MKWGFAGYGRIAKKFEINLRAAEGEQLVAIASRSNYKNLSEPIRGYSEYEQLFADPEIDIIYVNTIHSKHKAITIAALNAGKHVICEKPMGISRAEVDEMIEAAKRNNKFLMEAIWSRYLPSYRKVKEIIASGTLGGIELIQANFGFRMNPEDPKARLTEPDLAGGAIWDVGIYPISLAIDIYNEGPQVIQSQAILGTTGVEHRAIMNMRFSDNRMAQLSCGFDWTTKNHAIIQGTKGRIIMQDFWQCEAFTLETDEGEQNFRLPVTSTGMYHEIVGCSALISAGSIESPLISWEQSQLIASCMDMVIHQVRKKD